MIPFVKCILIDEDKFSVSRMQKLISLIPEARLEMISSYNNEIINQIKNIAPHIIFLEIELNKKDGFEIIQELNNYNINTNIVITSSQTHYSIKAIKYNVFDFLPKPIDIDELKQTIKKIQSTYFNFSTPNRNEGNLSDLSQREQEVVSLLVKGKTSKEISSILKITKNTVDTHRRKILEKTGVKSTIDLISTLKFK